MRTRRASILATAALAVAIIVPATPVAAQSSETSSGTVGATVTVAGATGACLSVSAAAVDFGTLPFSNSSPSTAFSTPQYDITNCGSSPAAMLARGTDATGAPWSLRPTHDTCSEGPNVFALDVPGPNDGEFVALSTADQHVFSLAEGTSRSGVDHQLTMPCQGSDGAGQQVSFDIIYTAVAT